ncbi:MAG: hypothetical protein MMC33_010108 [Icmadophila ericetorum]|nr:hypothetical protein [Icmadophila ericetorum]
MPRVAEAARSCRVHTGSPQKQDQPRIPLNDDRHEKAIRFQSRQALHDLQMNQIKLAASPMRRNDYPQPASNTPSVSRSLHRINRDTINGGALPAVTGTIMTPMKRVPILANFEEWMKLATDNKINATNSWNFALIDYFHDMSLLKEGDGVNFQKASCTLDGCIKIYTSRVDSVATETGKLLSGLADSANKKSKGSGVDDEEGDFADEDGENEEKKAKKRMHRSVETTLAPSFASLQVKKFELEFSVDPLFKKTSSDFDEGGAKGLLLNHLAINAEGRVVFDSSDNTEIISSAIETADEPISQKASSSMRHANGTEVQRDSVGDLATDIDLSLLGSKFFPDLDILNAQDICPSLKDIETSSSDAIFEFPCRKSPEATISSPEETQVHQLQDNSGIFLDDDMAHGFDDIPGAPEDGFDTAIGAGFGQGGQIWASNAILDPVSHDIHAAMDEGPIDSDGADLIPQDGCRPTEFFTKVSLRHDSNHQDILSYFDNALRKDWAGPENWRIRKLKSSTKASSNIAVKRKEKEPFSIDFAASLTETAAELIYTPASSGSVISLPKNQWKSKTRNLLPDDKHFNSTQLKQLFLKPKAHMRTRTNEEKYQSSKLQPRYSASIEPVQDTFGQSGNIDVDANSANTQPQGDYDANFFQDDAPPFANYIPDDDGAIDGDEVFVDAQQGLVSEEMGATHDSTPISKQDQPGTLQDGSFGSQLITGSRRMRPEYVNYARVAKKVDVRRLKADLWKGMGYEKEISLQASAEPEIVLAGESPPPLQFTTVVNGLQRVYSKQAMVDISTSYCFICLLHLANEKGLSLSNENDLEEFQICKDVTA